MSLWQLGPVTQLVARLIADLGDVSLILDRSHTLVEIYYEIFSMVILLIPLIHQWLVSVTSESMWTKYLLTNRLVKLANENNVVRLTDRFYMTIAVGWDVKPQTKQINASQKYPLTLYSIITPYDAFEISCI